MAIRHIDLHGLSKMVSSSAGVGTWLTDLRLFILELWQTVPGQEGQMLCPLNPQSSRSASTCSPMPQQRSQQV